MDGQGEPRTGKVAGVRKDVWGFGDLLVLIPGIGTTLVQATSEQGGGHHAAREHKIVTECWEKALIWLSFGNIIEVWSWAKRGPRGKRKLWTLKRRRLGQAPDQSWHWLEIEE